MRLRQIALVARDLDPVVAQFHDIFGLNVAYRDPAVGKYGLVNAVMPVGDAFLEVVQPTTGEASAARYLERKGGDAGYMVILQTADALAHRRRLLAEGLRMIEDLDYPSYVCTHFHPGDFGGILVSIDEARGAGNYLMPDGDWMPAGPDWRAARSHVSRDLTSVTIRAADPHAMAGHWGALLQAPPPRNDGEPELALARGSIRFATSADGTSVVEGISIRVDHPEAILAKAAAAGAAVEDGAVRIGGLRVTPVS